MKISDVKIKSVRAEISRIDEQIEELQAQREKRSQWLAEAQEAKAKQEESKIQSTAQVQKRHSRLQIAACKLVPKESAAAISKRKAIHRRLELGEVYGGRFKNLPANKKGYAPLVVLADEGGNIRVAPVITKTNRKNSVPLQRTKNFAGSVDLNSVCTIDKRLLVKKLGRIEESAISEIDSELLKRTMEVL